MEDHFHTILDDTNKQSLLKYSGVKVVWPSQISTLDILDALFVNLASEIHVLEINSSGDIETQGITSNVHLTEVVIDCVRHFNELS